MKKALLKFESLGQWHDSWAWVLLSAPNRFSEYKESEKKMMPVENQVAALSHAHEQLASGFHFAEKKLKDPFLVRIARELIEMAFEAYRAGDKKLGNHTLQECEGMIWPGRQMPVKYAVEAERRAFGAVTRYKDIRISPYPYEGTRSDLGESGMALLEVAEAHCKNCFQSKMEFKYFGWIRYADGKIEQLKEPSRKKLQLRFQSLAGDKVILGAVIAELVISPVSGLIVYNIHEKDRPRIEAISITKEWSYDALRFHLNEPTIFGNG